MLVDMLKGLLIGVCMLIPGVSGGTIAIICGIYYKLIAAVDTFFQNKRQSLKYLATVAIGGGIGVLIFSKPLLYIYNTYKIPMLYLFIGSVIGSLPLLIKNAGVKKINIHTAICLLAGVLVVILLNYIPKDLFIINTEGMLGYLILFLVGIILATALVLPGISFSYMLLIMGLYEQTLMAIRQVNIAYILSLGFGIIIGILLTAKIIRIVLRKYPTKTYLVIIGFVIASLKDIFPGIPNGNELFISVILFLGSFFTIYRVSQK